MSVIHYSPHSQQFMDQDWSVFDTQFPELQGLSDIGPFHRGNHRAINNAMTHAAPTPSLISADLIESEKDFQVHADLPGVSAENLDVSIIGKDLVIQAERSQVHKVNTHKVHSLERSYGKVSRSIRIPESVDVSKVTTKFQNGVVSVTMPKKEGEVAAVPVKLPVEVVK